MFLSDSHVHTSFSDDSVCPMECMLRQALMLGLDEITFTEHVDYGVKTDLNCAYDAYFATIKALQKRFEGQITIRAGIEFGVQVHTISQYCKDVQEYPFDFILLSNHQINNLEFWNQAYQKGRTAEEAVRDYYQAILEVQKNFKEYDAIAHLDLVRRYVKTQMPEEWILQLVDPILKTIIAEGKALEVNTSSDRYGLEDLMPSTFILRAYRSLGGTLLSLGSDAHEKKHLSHRMKEVRKMLRELGFETFCTYKKRQPIFHEL